MVSAHRVIRGLMVIALAVGMVAALGVATGRLPGVPAHRFTRNSLAFTEPRPAPRLELRRLGGEMAEVPLAEGRVTLLTFFATWCAPCLRELPWLERLGAEYAPLGLSLQFVNLAEAPSVVAAFTRQIGVSGNLWLDETGRAARNFGVSGLPATIVVDRQGRVRARWLGELPEASVRQRLAEVLAVY